MLLIVRKGLFWVARNSGSIENGPTMFFMTLTILIVFGSAFFTDVIGVHAIFGMLSTIVGMYSFCNWCDLQAHSSQGSLFRAMVAWRSL